MTQGEFTLCLCTESVIGHFRVLFSQLSYIQSLRNTHNKVGLNLRMIHTYNLLNYKFNAHSTKLDLIQMLYRSKMPVARHLLNLLNLWMLNNKRKYSPKVLQVFLKNIRSHCKRRPFIQSDSCSSSSVSKNRLSCVSCTLLLTRKIIERNDTIDTLEKNHI